MAPRHLEVFPMSLMFPHIPVLVAAALLAGASVPLALALWWESSHMLSYIRFAGRLGPWLWLVAIGSVLLGAGNIVPLFLGLWTLVFRLLFGYSPVLVINPQVCPSQPLHGPHYSCDPLASTVSAVTAIEFTWMLLVVAPIWFALSILALRVGVLARRRYMQQATARSR